MGAPKGPDALASHTAQGSLGDHVAPQYGRVLEGLEVRWGLVVRVLQALTRLGPWRVDGSIGPMHRWYDPRLFDVLSEEQVRWKYAPKAWRGELVSDERA